MPFLGIGLFFPAQGFRGKPHNLVVNCGGRWCSTNASKEYGYPLHKGSIRANHAVIFFHGFPGRGTRGMDLRAAVHEHSGLTTIVVN